MARPEGEIFQTPSMGQQVSGMLRNLFRAEVPQEALRQRGRQAKFLADLVLGQLPERPQPGAGAAANLAYMASLPGVLPLGKVVYHGTPHKFAPVPENPLGRFEMSKIGTGEGAQAYGHGIYLAESPGVARNYRLAGHGGPEIVARAQSPEYEALADYVRGFRPFGRAPMEKTENLLGLLDEIGTEEAARAAAAIRSGHVSYKDVGDVLRVDLPDEHIARMLDWDAPPATYQEKRLLELASENPRGRSRYRKGLEEHMADMLGISEAYQGQPEPGSAIYGTLASAFGGQPQASAALGRHGIPGLRYFDQMSRGAGEGTRNFVVWDPSILKILGVE